MVYTLLDCVHRVKTLGARLFYACICRYVALKARMPKGFYPAWTSGDGNCLFGAVSIALTGSESLSERLQLRTVIHGVQHFEHYSEMVG